jgi:Ca-activated chloride channel family protein
LIGYENRMLRKEDFNDDRKDAGEIGAGHTVTALYEIVPASAERDVEVPSVDPLRYQRTPAPAEGSRSGELLTLKLRYKEPEGDTSRLLEFPAVDSGARRGSPDFEFAAAVAGFGMLLRGSEQVGDFTFTDVHDLAARARGRGADREYRDELVRLVDRAAALD